MSYETGDLVVVTVGVPGLNAIHAVGRWEAPVPDRKDWAWLDVNMGVVHLPQMYRETELDPVTDDNLAYHGFCTNCRGLGITAVFEHNTMDAVIDGKHGPTCAECGGSGRTFLKIDMHRGERNTLANIEFPENIAASIPCPDCKRAFTPTYPE